MSSPLRRTKKLQIFFILFLEDFHFTIATLIIFIRIIAFSTQTKPMQWITLIEKTIIQHFFNPNFEFKQFISSTSKAVTLSAQIYLQFANITRPQVHHIYHYQLPQMHPCPSEVQFIDSQKAHQFVCITLRVVTKNPHNELQFLKIHNFLILFPSIYCVLCSVI